MEKKDSIPIEVIHKEIDLIQACISRMSSNAFFLKGWLVSLVAVILAILPEKINMISVIGILATIIICFWYLDAFFLRTEKMYRKLYEWVLVERKKGNKESLYDLNPHRFENEVDSIGKVMTSSTLKCFYGVPIMLIIIISLINLLPIICKEICKLMCK